MKHSKEDIKRLLRGEKPTSSTHKTNTPSKPGGFIGAVTPLDTDTCINCFFAKHYNSFLAYCFITKEKFPYEETSKRKPCDKFSPIDPTRGPSICQ